MDTRHAAHQLRQPLAAAEMHADLLATRLRSVGLAPDDPAFDLLHTVLEQLRALAGTIDQVFDGTAAAPVSDTGAAENRPLHGAMVALVEDDAAVRAGLEAVLVQAGAFVQAAASLPALLALLQIADRMPDLLLTDWRLPQGHSGRDVVLALRRQCAGRELHAFVLTADEHGARRGLLGMDQVTVLCKPVTASALVTSLAAQHQVEKSPLAR